MTGGGPGAVVKAAFLECRRSRVGNSLSFKLQRKHNFLPRSLVMIQTARVRILNPVSGGQCHLIYHHSQEIINVIGNEISANV